MKARSHARSVRSLLYHILSLLVARPAARHRTQFEEVLRRELLNCSVEKIVGAFRRHDLIETLELSLQEAPSVNGTRRLVVGRRGRGVEEVGSWKVLPSSFLLLVAMAPNLVAMACT